jgi:arginyl-tRNA synthetase
MDNSIKILLGKIWYEAVFTWCDNYHQSDLPNNDLINNLILFKSIFHGQNIIYQSSIPLKLAKISKLPPVVIAKEIMAKINFDHNNFQQIWQGEILPTGLINWRLTDYGISLCLQEIISINWHDLTASLLPTKMLIKQDYFAMQYPFMRCNSILKLAEYDHLIKLDCTSVNDLQQEKRQILRMIQPSILQWLNQTDQLLLQQSAERELIVYQNYIFDLIFYHQASYHLNFAPAYQPDHSNINWLKIVEQCAEKFDQFDRHCRIWGEIKDDDRPLAEARLGLILITHHLLAYVLTQLNIPLIREV